MEKEAPLESSVSTSMASDQTQPDAFGASATKSRSTGAQSVSFTSGVGLNAEVGETNSIGFTVMVERDVSDPHWFVATMASS